MLKPKQDADACLHEARDMPPLGGRDLATSDVGSGAQAVQQVPGAAPALPRGAKVLETSLLFASALLLLSWTAVLGWLVYELVTWLSS